MIETPESSREKRNSVIVRAAVYLPDGSHSERRVRNLSRSGACIEHDGDVRSGTTVLLQMGRLDDLTADVVWVRDRLAGLRFHEAVDLDEARKSRGIAVPPRAGWMTEMRNAYGR
ncbi:PilZ domain-containing protein [Sphingomonas sp. CLY1604]|uniref:PilZ domain-containing protein n=1 Tax=Sphingomonas sp. CLY1604 TaxID=3457786 RepID=UPI003FD798A0